MGAGDGTLFGSAEIGSPIVNNPAGPVFLSEFGAGSGVVPVPEPPAPALLFAAPSRRLRRLAEEKQEPNREAAGLTKPRAATTIVLVALGVGFRWLR